MLVLSLVKRFYNWNFTPDLPREWQRTAVVTILFVGLCFIISSTRVYYSNVIKNINGVQKDTRRHLHFIDSIVPITNYLLRLTGDGWTSFCIIAFFITIIAYFFRQKIRILYGVLETSIGIQISVSSLYQLYSSITRQGQAVADHDQAVMASLFASTGGIYLVIRGLTNMNDGIIIIIPNGNKYGTKCTIKNIITIKPTDVDYLM